MFLLVVSEYPLELLLLALLYFRLLAIYHDLFAYLLLLLHDLLGHVLLYRRLLQLLLRDLLIHQLALLVDLLHERLILRAQLRVLVRHVLLLGEALAVLADLKADLRQVRFEIGYDVLPLDLFGGDYPLVVVLEGLVLVLVLAGQHLILVKYDLGAPLLLIIHVVRLVDEELILQLKLNVLLVRVLQLLQDFLEVELVQLLYLRLTVKVGIVENGFKLGDKLVSLCLGGLAGASTRTAA